MSATYTPADLKAFDDLELVASHFGLPLMLPSRIFSRFLDERGCANETTPDDPASQEQIQSSVVRRDLSLGSIANYNIVKKRGMLMTLQTVELLGERYVILREKEFRELEQRAHSTTPALPEPSAGGKFREVTPLRVGGVPASELLIQDRR